MKTALTSPECTTEIKTQLPLSVLVAYEDFAAANQARKVCDYLLHQPGKKTQVSQAMWKFNLLQNEKLRDMASQDAAAADMLIVAMHGDGDLPEEVKTWLTLWLQQRGEHRTALMVVSGPGVDSREGLARNSPLSPGTGQQSTDGFQCKL